MLESYLNNRLKNRSILLMTHIVIGYPTLDASYEIVETMVEAGVDLMELQIPFSEPIADGPVILKANQTALQRGITVKDCFDFAQNVTAAYDIPFLFMSYYNILFKFGMKQFAGKMQERGLKGAIVPDLPPEEGQDYLESMDANGLDPIYIFSPTTPPERMAYLSGFAKGFIYCVARKGVTGMNTQFSESLTDYLKRCRQATNLPLAVGFGVKDKADIAFLNGKADIAVIGTQTIRLMDDRGVDAVGDFIHELKTGN